MKLNILLLLIACGTHTYAQADFKTKELISTIEGKIVAAKGLQFDVKKSPYRYHISEAFFRRSNGYQKFFLHTYEHLSLDEKKTTTKTFTFDPTKITEILDDKSIDAPCVRMITIKFKDPSVKVEEDVKTWKTKHVTKLPMKTTNSVALYYFGKSTQDFNEMKRLLLELKKVCQAIKM